jgi:hypothetical protein
VAKHKNKGERIKKPGAAARRTRAAQTVTAERAIDEALVQRTLNRISRHEHAGAEGRRAIGERIFVDYFGKDEQLVGSKSPVKLKSFVRLTGRVEDETSWDERDLCRAVSGAIVFRSLSSAVSKKLPASYLYQLASIDDLAVRAAVADKIARGELRGRVAQTAIAAAGRVERGGGRKTLAASARGLASLESVVRRLEEDDAFAHDEIRELEDQERAARRPRAPRARTAREVEGAPRRALRLSDSTSAGTVGL